MIKNIIIICILLFLIYKVFYESNNKRKHHNNKIKENNLEEYTVFKYHNSPSEKEYKLPINIPSEKEINKRKNQLLPCQQDKIYEFNKYLNQPSDKYDDNNNIKDKITQQTVHNKSIKEVYDSLIIDYKDHSNPNQPILEANNIDLSNDTNNFEYSAYDSNPLLSSVSLF